MSTITTETPYASTTVTADGSVRPLCWGAVLAGAVVALSAHLLITMFGLGLGLQMIDLATEPEPGRRFSIGVGVTWSVSALLSLWLGGWIAGRLAPEPNRRLGAIHGVLVWSVATVATAFAVTTGSGLLLGGVAKLAGEGLSFVGQQAAPAAAAAGGDFVKRAVDANPDLLGSFTREVAPQPAAGPEGASARPANPAAAREVSWALVRFFSREKADRNAEAKTALVHAVAGATGGDELQAREKVDAWIASYDQVQADLADLAQRAEVRARAAAEEASGYITQVAVWSVIAFLIGAIAAAWGGTSGARCRRDYDAGTPTAGAAPR